MTMQLKDLDKYLERLGGRVVNQASARSINRALTTARKDATKIVRDRYKIKTGDVRKLTNIKRAKADKGSIRFGGLLTVIDKPVGLEKYGPKSKRIKTGRGMRQGVTVNVKGIRKLVKSGFLAKGKLWKRDGSSRLPIRRLFGPSVANALNNKSSIARLRKIAMARFEAEFSREMVYQLQKRS